MAAAQKSKSIRSGGKPKTLGGRAGGLLFGFMFFGIGALLCWMMGLNPLLKSLNSKDWIETKCTIVSSEIERHSSSDGTTYSIEISFRYKVDGKKYVSDTYNFDNSSSSGYSGKAEVVARYPVKSKHSCWVNPDEPTQAVLNRNTPGIVYFVIPFTLVFMLIGLCAFAGTFGLLPKSWQFHFGSQHQRVSAESAGTQSLKPSASGIGKVIGITFAACFWNGIVSIFVIQVVKSHLSDNPEWFLTVFMIPFVVIGIVLVFAIFHSLLALANPKLELILSEASPRLGEPVQLEWRSDKPLHRLRKLSITLTGQEVATYRRGTNSVTDRATFHHEILLKLDQPATQEQGILNLTIPINSMHNFDSGNNKIEWHLEVNGDIPRYPDINDSYPITVRPLSSHFDTYT